MNAIQKMNYKHAAFNAALLECLGRVQLCCCEIDPSKEPVNAARATKMAEAFYTDMLKLNDRTINEVKKSLEESCTFIKDCLEVAEVISENKCCDAENVDLETSGRDKVELSEEDQAIIDRLFDAKAPAVQIQTIRDSAVASLLAEDKKARAIKDALNMANSKVAAGEDPKTVNETIERLNAVGPTSLMNAIMNATAGLAVKDVNENASSTVSVDKILSENAEKIRERAVMLYCLYETSNVMAMKTWSAKEVQEEAKRIYYGK